MRILRIAFAALSVIAMNTTCEAEEKWDYPAGRTTVNEMSAGKSGRIRVFQCETPDTSEQVILWYGDRLGLDDDYSLFVAASEGFDQLEQDKHFQHGFGHDTEERRDDTQLVGQIRGGHAHISFLHRPDYRLPSVVTVSIAETPSGTSVHVIEPTIVGDENASEHHDSADKLSKTK